MVAYLRTARPGSIRYGKQAIETVGSASYSVQRIGYSTVVTRGEPTIDLGLRLAETSGPNRGEHPERFKVLSGRNDWLYLIVTEVLAGVC